jgi:hypothetical protein
MKQLRILAKMAGLNPLYGKYFSNGFSRFNALPFLCAAQPLLCTAQSVAVTP